MDSEPVAGEIDLLTVKSRTLSGIVTLISRTFVIRVISLIGISLLSFYLKRYEFGLFAAINNLVIILGYFSDVGLAASLVQKKDSPTVSDLRTTFTLQQILVISGCIVMFLLAPGLARYYQFPAGGVFLFNSLLLAFFLASLKTIPSVILERHLLFKNLAAVEVVENIVYWFVAVFFAWRGDGIYAYAWAVMLRGIVGTALIYFLSPWPIGFSLSKSSLNNLLKFGLPYQLNTFIAVVKDRFIELVVWKIIGTEGVGIISWARNYSEQPLRLVMDNVTKVTFPTFSRMQNHPNDLKKSLEKTLFFISAATFPFTAGLAILAPEVVRLIPKYSKWQDALFPLTLFCINTAWASISTPLSNTLNSLGKVKINTALMLMWLALAWGLTPVLAHKFGYLGVAYATAIISVFSIIPIVIVQKITGFQFSQSILKPLLATVAMLLITIGLKTILPSSWPTLILNVLISGVVFLAALYGLTGPQLLIDLTKMSHAFRQKK